MTGLSEVKILTVAADINEFSDPIDLSSDEKVDVIAGLHSCVIGKSPFVMHSPCLIGWRQFCCIDSITRVQMQSI
jgi:hypothetical protein